MSRHTPHPGYGYLLLVLAPGRVQRLDEGGGVSDEHGVAGGAHDHAEHGDPQVRHADGRPGAVADAQHVAHGLEQRVRVLLPPRIVLRTEGAGWGERGRGGERGGGQEEGEALVVFALMLLSNRKKVTECDCWFS